MVLPYAPKGLHFKLAVAVPVQHVALQLWPTATAVVLHSQSPLATTGLVRLPEHPSSSKTQPETFEHSDKHSCTGTKSL